MESYGLHDISAEHPLEKNISDARFIEDEDLLKAEEDDMKTEAA